LVAKLFGVVLVLVIAAAGVSAYTLGLGSSYPGVSSTSTSTTASTCTTTSLVGSTADADAYNVSSSSPVRVDYVHANFYTSSNGSRSVQFEVGITNVGSSPVYVIRGCGSSLSSTLVQGEGVVKTVNVIRCLCAEAPSGVAPGQSSTLVGPGCWSGYIYSVVSPGTFTVKLTVSWSPTGNPWTPTGNTTVFATFTAT
jgi:hypothetical protein